MVMYPNSVNGIAHVICGLWLARQRVVVCVPLELSTRSRGSPCLSAVFAIKVWQHGSACNLTAVDWGRVSRVSAKKQLDA